MTAKAIKTKRINVRSTPKRKAGLMFGKSTSYSFVDKDPICDMLRTICAPYHLNEVSDKSGVPISTLWNMFFGPTVSPRYCTVARIVRSLDAMIRIGQLPRGPRS